MPDLWRLMAFMIPILFFVLVGAVWLGRRYQQRQTRNLVDAIKARGSVTIAETEDGEPCCPHCGHSLRSRR